jgi:hypothetical protein
MKRQIPTPDTDQFEIGILFTHYASLNIIDWIGIRTNPNLRRKTMAKSDLLKEAIADAKAVKETALANAKIALQEAFGARMENMLSAKLESDLGEDEEEMGMDDAAMGADMAGEEEADLDSGMGTDVGDLSIDVDQDGEFDKFDIYSDEELGGEEGMEGEETPMGDEEMAAEYQDQDDEDLNLEAIIRELEGDLNEEDYSDASTDGDEIHEGDDMKDGETDEYTNESIDEIIEAILREEDEAEMPAKEKEETVEENTMKEELEEAYATVNQLKGILSEVNLLNAKLLYTNKLFRNFELTEAQKMKVIENFDRAGNTREVKLVFTTLAESFNRPATKKRVVKESYASKPTATTAPAKETTQVLSEGFELANRWKKLAGLL